MEQLSLKLWCLVTPAEGGTEVKEARLFFLIFADGEVCIAGNLRIRFKLWIRSSMMLSRSLKTGV